MIGDLTTAAGINTWHWRYKSIGTIGTKAYSLSTQMSLRVVIQTTRAATQTKVAGLETGENSTIVVCRTPAVALLKLTNCWLLWNGSLWLSNSTQSPSAAVNGKIQSSPETLATDWWRIAVNYRHTDWPVAYRATLKKNKRLNGNHTCMPQMMLPVQTVKRAIF